MAWQIAGTYFETCSCEVVCPCTASLALGADALEHQRVRRRVRGQGGVLVLAVHLGCVT
jgi:hypothetical protein